MRSLFNLLLAWNSMVPTDTALTAPLRPLALQYARYATENQGENVHS